VGVTGERAYGDAMLRVQTLTMKLNKAATLKGAELDKMIADMRTEVNTDREVSLIAKKDLITKLEKVNEGQKTAGKADKKAQEKAAKEAGETLANQALAAGGDTFVAVVNAGGGDDAKALSAASEVISKKCSNQAVCLLSNAGGKLAVLAVVPQSLQGKYSAKDWTGKVLDAIGGKGGGKDDKAQGTHPDPNLLDKALAEAKAYAAGGGGGGGGAPAAKGKAGKEDKKKGKEPAKEEKKDDPEADRKKLLKSVIKEGGKRGVEVEGAADMGGLQFFCTSMDCPNGDENLLVESMKAMNAKSDPTEEERKGGSGHIGKMIFSAGAEQLAVVAYVPEAKQGELSCEEWLQKVLDSQPASKLLSKAKDVCVGVVPTNSDKGVFPLKIREPMILEANNFLRKKGLFPEDDGSDDDEFIFGDDDFPSM